MPLILVTGGTKGIGRAITERFIRGGFDALVTARSEKDLIDFQAYIFNKYPDNQLFILKNDASHQDSTKEILAEVSRLNLSIDVLVNNVGQFVGGTFQTEPDGLLEHLFQVNVASAYHLTRGLLPMFIAQKSGYIVNICSTASNTPYPGSASYGISKFAMLGFSKILRESLKQYQIKVTTVLPGATLTGSWEGVPLPANRLMPPEDLAEILWTCNGLSPASVVEEITLRPMLGDISDQEL